MTFFEANELSELERMLLVERHLASPALAAGDASRGLLVDGCELLSVMVNEEDHLRAQAILPGLQIHEVWQAVQGLERDLSEHLCYAWKPRWGYLTACPTNTGTGLRASVLIHLPGLVLTQEMERVARGVTEMAFAVRGLYGEGTEASGNLFQISNQVTLGRSEEELLSGLCDAVGELLACEDRARGLLLRDARAKVEDKVWRAYGILRYARTLSSQEVLNLTSAVRLGNGLGILRAPAHLLNALMVLSRPAHLQYRSGRRMEPEERDSYRAEFVREHMQDEDAS